MNSLRYLSKSILLTSIGLFLSCSDSSEKSESSPLVISEVCYHAADSTIAEFIEIWNPSEQAEKIAGFKIRGEVDFDFAENNEDLAPNSRITIYRDPQEFAKHHPNVPAYGPYVGSLSNSEGELRLEDSKGNIVFELNYENQSPWPLAAAGLGYCLTLVDSSLAKHPEGWTAGAQFKGNPNNFDQTLTQKLYINEIMPLDSNGGSWIEIFNSSSENIELANYSLYSEIASTQSIPLPNTQINPSQYLIIANDNTSFTNTVSSMNFDLNGGQIYLIEKIDNQYTGQISELKFEALALGQSAGPSSLNKEYAMTLLTPTPESANSEFIDLGLRITEIHYHPIDDDFEFIEFQNFSDKEITIFKDSLVIQKMKTKGIDVTPTSSLILLPNEKLIALSEDILIADFIKKYPNASQTKIIPYSGKLSNSGEELRVYLPGQIILGSDQNLKPSLQLCDIVSYRDFWYDDTDGKGNSLNRTDSSIHNDANNWTSAQPTPGE